MIGGLGNDVYYVDNVGDSVREAVGAGYDVVYTSAPAWTLDAGSEVEKIVAATGTASINITGNAFAQELDGNAGNNVLDGGAGADTLVGGKGNDTYVVDDPGDVVVENAGEGTDTVKTSLSSYTLGANVENLTYTGTGAFYGTGNSLSNILTTSSATATLAGGAGDDYYQVGNTATTIVELPGGGKDTIVATANFVLPANVEVLRIYGQGLNGGYTGVGNGDANTLVGDNNNQTLVGLGGNDTLTGGGGKDTFAFDAGSGHDVVTDWNSGDTIRLGAGFGLNTFALVAPALAQVGANVVLTLSPTDDVTFQNTTLSQFSATNFQLQLDTSSFTLAFSDEFNGPLSLYNPLTGQGTWFTQFGYKYAQGAGLHTLASTGEREIFVDPNYAGTGTTPLGLNPFNVHDGQLDITVANTPTQDLALLYNRAYTSGLLTSQASFSETYGYFEVRAQLPTGSGAWPAFWLLPTNGAVPPEIDILEGHGSAPGVNVATLHDAGVAGGATGRAVFLPSLTSGFHTYGFLWGPQTLTWYVDGTQVAQMATPVDMNQPMYILLNLAVDGYGAISPTNLPTPLSVDYVHAYATPDTLTTAPGLYVAGTSLNDTLLGGAGDDTLTGSFGDDVLDGRGGTNTAQYQGVHTGYVVANDPATGGYYVTDVGNVGEGRDHLINITNLKFSDGTFTAASLAVSGQALVGTAAADYLVGGGADDTLTGGGGNDTLDGGVGVDTAVYAGPSADYLVLRDPIAGGYYITNLGGEGEGRDHLANVERVQFTDGTFQVASLAAGALVLGVAGYAETLAGGAGNDRIEGGEGGDTIDGGAGTDTVVYAGPQSQYVVSADGAGGYLIADNATPAVPADHLVNVELVQFSDGVVPITQLVVVNQLIQGTSAAEMLIGARGNDTFVGGGGDDTLDGGAGVNTAAYAGPAADYHVLAEPSTGGYVVVDTGAEGEGTDHLLRVQQLQFADGVVAIGSVANGAVVNGTTASEAISGTAGDDLIAGGGGEDTIDGGGGADTVVYRGARAEYVVLNDPATGGWRVEDQGAAGDGVQHLTNILHLQFADGAVYPNGTSTGLYLAGTAGPDSLTGGAGDDLFAGLGGGDTIDGGDGADTIVYAGPHTRYLVQSDGAGGFTVIDSLAGEGVAPDHLANVETIRFSDLTENVMDAVPGLNLVGGAGPDLLTGDVTNDTLTGGGGDDTLDGGAGKDVAVFAGPRAEYRVLTEVATGGLFVSDLGGAGDAQDHLVNIEQLQFSDGLVQAATAATGLWVVGGASDDTLAGGVGNDLITGGPGNDAIDGGSGTDMAIYAGSLAEYVVTPDGSGGFTVVDTGPAGEGTDHLTHIARLAFADGSVDPSAVSAAVSLSGTGAPDLLIGAGGADTLDGGAGADTLVGGAGNDVYLVGNAGDAVVESAGGGCDTVYASVSWTATPNAEIERIVAVEGAGTIALTANAVSTELDGNSQCNLLIGGAGNDTLYGGGANDTLVGGGGTDTARYVGPIADYVVLQDGTTTGYVVLGVGPEGEKLDHLSGVASLQFADANLATADVSVGRYVLGGAGADSLTATSGSDILKGGAGNDTLDGGAGIDTAQYAGPPSRYTVTPDGAGGFYVSDSVAGGDGVDHLLNVEFGRFGRTSLALNDIAAGAAFTGTAGADTLIGAGGADTLDGGAGIDTLVGGGGNDTYYVDNAKDVVTEAAGGGYDTVFTSASWMATAGSEIEKVVATGSSSLSLTGNGLAMELDGNGGINTLDDGGGPATLAGGAGNDTYLVRNAGTVVVELANGGYDTVKTTLGAYTLTDQTDVLTFIGTGAFRGTGNALNNVLTGGDGNDTLDGGAGADRLVGGKGDDTYYVDNSGDSVVENAGEGRDTVYTTLSTLSAPANVEVMTFIGTGNFVGHGNDTGIFTTGAAGNDWLYGGKGVDTLWGLSGADTLTGGAGADSFILNGPGLGTTRITDFQPGVDHVLLLGSAFGLSSLSGVAFVNGPSSAPGAPSLDYDSTGKLYWDSVGGDPSHHVLVATFDSHPTISISDFILG